MKSLRVTSATCISIAALSIALACTKSQSGTESDSGAAKANAGQITDSILPGGPNGAFTSTSSTPTTRTNTSNASRPSTPSKPKISSGGEQDSAIQPKFSIDEKGVVRPIKH